MKPNLKRIEAILHDSGIISTTSYPEPNAKRKADDWQTRRTYSFEISHNAQKRNSPAQWLRDTPNQSLGEGTLFPTIVSVQLPAQQSAHKEPTLPKFNPRFSSHRNGSNTAFKMHLLPKTQTDVAADRAELQQVVLQIQDIYHQGPMVDGWLESHPHEPEREALTQRGQSVDRRMDYVEEVCSFEQGKVTCESPRAGYRLCGLDAAGQKWSRPCPVDQLASVSLAIARYQKLQQLLERKQYLETRLSQMQESSP
jgi:hypothetical protein